ncbi:hypothetical protein FNU76_19220 [Chitinimonas arctica]|uniref:Phage tail fibre protein N-terminal domain-containing protein n=1 Tax=Chitinimonas arctica TaxID=2594795 RepID=A0A516SJH2_9NEIS|nr:phage tail protein [Chitinimonas arctica]QDQ28309.1 hypothetical protein FNU76_19220 [Chitinimonas arctica]
MADVQNWFTLPTEAGLARIAQALAKQQTIELTQMAVGDGGGVPVVPDAKQTRLVRETWRGPISLVAIDAQNAGWITANIVIPIDVGGFTIREIGLFDSTGTLIAVANCADRYKPVLSQGMGVDTVMEMVVALGNASVVNLSIDPSKTLASRQWVLQVMGQQTQLPLGGLPNQILVKKTAAAGDAEWRDVRSLFSRAERFFHGQI